MLSKVTTKNVGDVFFWDTLYVYFAFTAVTCTNRMMVSYLLHRSAVLYVHVYKQLLFMERLQYKVWMLCKRVCWWKQKHIIRWCSSSMRWCIIIVATRSGQRFKHSDSVFRSHRRLLRTALEARQLCFLCIWDLLPVWVYWFVWPVVCNIRSARGLHGPKILGPARPGPTKLRPSPARPVEINTKIGPAQRGSVNKKPGPARPGPSVP